MANVLKALGSFLSGARTIPQIRQGAKPINSPMYRRGRGEPGAQARERAFSLPARTVAYLADSDDIIVAIRRSIRTAIGDMEWKIIPDVARQKNDLHVWQKYTELNLAMPGLDLAFTPQVLDPAFFVRASGALRDLLQSEHHEDEMAGGDGSLGNNARIREFFENCLQVHNAVAERHAERVRELFEHPEPQDEAVSFRSFADKIIDALTLHDAAPIVKNPSQDGERLGEMYLLPAEQIRLYRCSDLKRPQPPAIAFDWSQNDQIRAYYTTHELAYLTANPQPDGYGKPPIEALFTQIMASQFGDAYMLDFFANNNAPRGVFDLGPNLPQEERDACEERWNNLARNGLRRIMFVSNSENVKGFIPIPEGTNKDSEIIAAFELWAKRKCAVFGLNLGDIGFTENLHRTTAEDQSEKSQSRGINSLARSIAGQFNSQVVRGHFWVRDDPTDPLNLDGHALPIFPFSDVKFEWIMDDAAAKDKDEASNAVALIGAGVVTINEERKERGLPPIPGGDIATTTGTALIKVADLKILPPPQAPPAPGGPEPGGEPGGEESGGKPTEGDDESGPQPSRSKGPGTPAPKPQTLEKLARRLAAIVQNQE